MLLASFLILFLSGLINLYFSIQILRKVKSADIKISFFELRLQVHKNFKSYKQISLQQDGRLGTEYYGYWGSLLLMLVALLFLLSDLPWQSLS